MKSHIGEIAALVTAVCWALNGIAFESAGKKIGSFSLSYIRLFIGFVLGDIFFLFQAYVEMGSRISLLIMSVAPPLTALIGFIFLKERISP